jgi:gluconokinase
VENLPPLADAHAVVGEDSNHSRIVNGSGDGFMANIGSGCADSRRISITMGTSAAVRQLVSNPVLDPNAGTFCYRADSANAFLLGCASSNGGNALDWARREFNVSQPELQPSRDIPVFLPWLNGERSLEWNPELKPVWAGRKPAHGPRELLRAVMEGVVFNLAQYVEVIEKASGVRASQFVLSGNGFLEPAAAPMLAALLSRETLQPEEAGLGTLRGAAITAWRALGHDAAPAVERLLLRADRVVPTDDEFLHERFLCFKQLRGRE